MVSGLKCFKKSDFISDPKVKNKLMDRYYLGMNKVMRSVFYDDFVNKKIAFRDEDLYEIGLVYFISRFLHSELPRTFIKKVDFDLIESGHYLNDIVFTDEEELEFNLGAIHQDSLGHEHRNDSDHSVPPITEDAFSVLKNEIVNARRHMSLFQEKVDSQFNGMREFVEEFVKLILNELKFVKQQSSEFVEKEDTPQQGPQSNDCGMFVCAFAEYVSHGIFDISSTLFGVVNHRLRYDTLLWDYARRKQNNGAVCESEVTGNVTSKHGGFKRSRKHFGSSRTR
ncbi:hypothetical protein FXO38_22678 [Capsicum annuum]|nr:hypothetical protein FXO37_34450 [Capsicum annuum]KAF3639397.1 hypothetical protein FXO38_22678 [Capsicum annuum]